MKQHILNSIIGNLKDDPYYAVKIVDLTSGTDICNNLMGGDMINDSGSVEEWFNTHIYKAGIKQFSVTVRRKNGKNAFKTTPEPVQVFNLSGGKVIDTTPQTPAQSPAAASHDPGQPLGGLNGNNILGLMGGLHGMEISSRYMNYPEVVRDRDKYRDDNERLKDEIATLKEKLLENKFADSKAAGTSELLMGLMQLAPQLAASFKGGGGGEAPGLNAASGEGLSPDKQQVIQYITSQSDGTAHYLLCIIKGFGNAEYQQELQQLLEKHNLIQ